MKKLLASVLVGLVFVLGAVFADSSLACDSSDVECTWFNSASNHDGHYVKLSFNGIALPVMCFAKDSAVSLLPSSIQHMGLKPGTYAWTLSECKDGQACTTSSPLATTPFVLAESASGTWTATPKTDEINFLSGSYASCDPLKQLPQAVPGLMRVKHAG